MGSNGSRILRAAMRPNKERSLPEMRRLSLWRTMLFRGRFKQSCTQGLQGWNDVDNDIPNDVKFSFSLMMGNDIPRTRSRNRFLCRCSVPPPRGLSRRLVFHSGAE